MGIFTVSSLQKVKNEDDLVRLLNYLIKVSVPQAITPIKRREAKESIIDLKNELSRRREITPSPIVMFEIEGGEIPLQVECFDELADLAFTEYKSTALDILDRYGIGKSVQPKILQALKIG